MKRATWISIVDVLAFCSFALLITTGVLIRYVLPPGSGRIEAAGQGWGAQEKVVSVVWGLTRHEWGPIHFWLSVTFMAVNPSP